MEQVYCQTVMREDPERHIIVIGVASGLGLADDFASVVNRDPKSL